MVDFNDLSLNSSELDPDFFLNHQQYESVSTPSKDYQALPGENLEFMSSCP